MSTDGREGRGEKNELWQMPIRDRGRRQKSGACPKRSDKYF